jgi:hypothetical protein
MGNAESPGASRHPRDGGRDFNEPLWRRVDHALNHAAWIAMGDTREYPHLAEFGIATTHDVETYADAAAWFRDAFETLSRGLPPLEHAMLAYKYFRMGAGVDCCYPEDPAADASFATNMRLLTSFGFAPAGAGLGVLGEVMPVPDEAVSEARERAIDDYVKRWRRWMVIRAETLNDIAMTREDGSESFAARVRATLMKWMADQIDEGDAEIAGDEASEDPRSDAYWEGVHALDVLLVQLLKQGRGEAANREARRIDARARFIAKAMELRRGLSHVDRAELTRYQYRGLVHLDCLYLPEAEGKAALVHDLWALMYAGGLGSCDDAAAMFLAVAEAVDKDPDKELEREIEQYVLEWYHHLRMPSAMFDHYAQYGSAFAARTSAKVRAFMGKLVVEIKERPLAADAEASEPEDTGQHDTGQHAAGRDFNEARYGRAFRGLDYAFIAVMPTDGATQERLRRTLPEYGLTPPEPIESHSEATAWFRGAFDTLSAGLSHLERGLLTGAMYQRLMHVNCDFLPEPEAKAALISDLRAWLALGPGSPQSAVMHLLTVARFADQHRDPELDREIEACVRRWTRSLRVLDAMIDPVASTRPDGSPSLSYKVRAMLREGLGSLVVDPDAKRDGR